MQIEPAPREAPQQGKHDVYYEGNKKNELNDLKVYFKRVVSSQELTVYRKEIVKKITLLTTQGVDTSRFYPEMVIASATSDLVEKKLIFNYLTIYSQLNADFARMAVNTFTKDSYSANPAIRAIAIRNLSNLRFKGRDEYLLPVLKQGLADFSPIVRKACLMGLAKLIHEINRKSAEPVRDEDLLNQLYGMLRDNDPHVICCALEAINEIEPEGIAMSKKLAQYLLGNMGGYDDIQLSIVLGYLELYDPKSEEEITQVLSQLETKIRSQNLALVLAITKIFLKYGTLHPKFLPKIHAIVKPCLLAFIGSPFPEIESCALQHIIFLIKKHGCQDYRPDIKKFYLREGEPTYLKALKIELMELCCSKDNFTDVVNELTEYLREEEIIENVMQAFTRMILRFEEDEGRAIIKTLNDVVVNFTANELICNEAIKTIRGFLRKYPHLFSMLEHTFYTYVRGVTTNEARCAMIEIIGDHGEHIEDAVELIVWTEGNLEDDLIIALLRANVKLFFKRPIEMLNMLTNLFRSVLTNEETHLSVKDYATMLYLGLQTDAQAFKKTFLSTRSFSEGIKISLPDLQFNSLEIAYGQPKSSWLIEKSKYIQLLDQLEYEAGEMGMEGEAEEDPEAEMEKKRSKVDLSSMYHKIEPEHIDNDFQMDADSFEMYWENYEAGSSITRIINQAEAIDEETLEELFKMWSVKVIASADTEESIKQFLYIRLLSGDLACLELEVNKEIETLTLLIKSENQEFAGFVSQYVESFLKLNEII